MTAHGGFAAVAQVHQSALQDALRIYHSAGSLPSRVAQAGTMPNPLGSGTLAYDLDLFLDAPTVRLAAASGDRIALDLRLWGRARITTDATGTIERAVLLTSTLLVRGVVTVDATGMLLRPMLADVAVDALGIRALDGPALPPQLGTFLSSPGTRSTLGLLLRANLGALNSMAPPLMTPLLRQLGITGPGTSSTFRLRVRDASLALALDVATSTPAGTFRTMGDFAAITQAPPPNGLLVSINPALLPLLTSQLRPRVVAAAAAAGIAIDRFDVTPAEGHLLVSGHATRDGLGASFRLRARPRLGLPDRVEHWEDEDGRRYTHVTPGHDNVWIEVYDAHVEEDRPWWAWLGVIVGALIVGPFGPPALMTVASIIESIRNNVAYSIDTAGDTAVGARRTQRLRLPGTTGPEVDLTLARLSMGSASLDGTVILRVPTGMHGILQGPTTLDVAELPRAVLRYTLTGFPMRSHAQDPQAHVRWQVRRTDTNAVVQTRELRLVDPGSLSHALDLRTGPLATAPGFVVSCRAYRRLGTTVEELANQSLELRISDRLDRTRPYVRWTHSVHAPEVVVHVDGRHEQRGWRNVARASDIHRTDARWRCRMVANHSRHARIEYLDALPFPTAELSANRARVCDYCFYGGPTRTTPVGL